LISVNLTPPNTNATHSLLIQKIRPFRFGLLIQKNQSLSICAFLIQKTISILLSHKTQKTNLEHNAQNQDCDSKRDIASLLHWNNIRIVERAIVEKFEFGTLTEIHVKSHFV
jgi:hypothetical protein